MESGVLSVYGLIFVIFLIIPGIFFKRFYFSGPFHKQFYQGFFADRIITSLFWGVIVQLLTLVFFSFAPLNNFTFLHLKKAIFVIIGATNLHEETDENLLFQSLWLIVKYEVVTVMLSVIFGFTLYQTVKNLKLDLIFKGLQFQNQWHYFFNGIVLNDKPYFQNKKYIKKRLLAVYIDIVLDTTSGDGKHKLISGTLSHYTLCKNGTLEYIYLSHAQRYKDSKAIPIPGEAMVIPFSRVLDMNVYFAESQKPKEEYKVFKNIKTFVNKVVIPLVLVILLGFVFFLPFWVSNVNFIFRILGFIFSLISWVILIAFLGNNTNKMATKSTENIENRLTFGSGIIIVIFILLFAWLSCWAYEYPILTNLVKYLKSLS